MNDPQEFAVEVAHEAGEILLRYFGTKLTRNIKTGPHDYATEADVAAEKLIVERITDRFPNDAIVAEESGAQGAGTSGYTWIVDPLDGTRHFAEGREDFAVMITRAHGEGLELAVVWNPKKEVLAVGETGKGAWLNGTRVVLETKVDDDALLSVERDDQERLRREGYRVRNVGASGNTLIALAGERQALVSSNGFIWDYAPPALLLAEAGWVVTDFKGRSFRWDGKVVYHRPGIIAAPVELHQQLTAVLIGQS